MAWELVAEGTPDTFQSTGAIDDLPHGTRIKLEVDTLWGLAYLANIWGAEWVIQQFIAADITITDSYSVGPDRVIVEGYVSSPVAVTTIILVVLAVLGIAGIAYIVHELRLWAQTGVVPSNLVTVIKWGAIGAIGVLGIKLVTQLLAKPRRA
ncbi:unnamed protein product [marine sediment metagenome]|uniref:Uncharacterized protein n=1 Tax=marine sediment metagenome TaxID=412755 RepID=X1P263_9ZZZZ